MQSLTLRRAGSGLVLLGALAVPAAGQDSTAPASAATPAAASTPAAPPERAVRSPGNAEWATTAEAAVARAREQHKLVFYEFASPRCDNCSRMDTLLYPAFDFEALLIGMVPVKIALDTSNGIKIAERFGIKEAPAVVITTAEGRLAFMMKGFKDPQDFYGHVHRDLETHRAFSKKIDAQNVATLPAAEALASARQLAARLDYAEARPRFRRAATAPGSKPEVREAAMEGLASTELEVGDSVESRKTIDKLIRTTQNADTKERAELFRAQIPLAERKPDEALALYKKFEKDHPRSRYLDQVRTLIERLTPGEAPR